MSHELWLREVSRQLHMEDGWTGEANTVEQAADAFAELQAEIATLQRELAGATRRIKELQTEVSQCDGVFIDATDTIQQLRRELAEAKQRADENAERTLVIMAERDALKSWQESIKAEAPVRTFSLRNSEYGNDVGMYEQPAGIGHYVLRNDAEHLAAKLVEAQEAGWLLAMRLLQSYEQLDDAELAARDGFIAAHQAQSQPQPLGGEQG